MGRPSEPGCRPSPTHTQAMWGAIGAYLSLSDRPSAASSAVDEQAALAALSPEERKKLKQRQRKEEQKRAKQLEADKSKRKADAAEAAAAAAAASPSTKRDATKAK